MPLPFVMPFSTPKGASPKSPTAPGGSQGSAGGAVSRTQPKSSTGYSAQNPAVHPIAAPPVQTSFGMYASKYLETQTQALSGAVQQYRSLPLPTGSDIVALELDLTLTITSSTNPTYGSVDTVIDHLEILQGGTTVATISGGQFLRFNYLRYSPQRSNLSAVTIVDDASTSMSIVVWNTVLAAAKGPYFVNVYYAPFSALITAGTAPTAASVSTNVTALFGDAQGLCVHYARQSLSLAVGDNMIQSLIAPQDVQISELLVVLPASGYFVLSYIDIICNGSAVFPHMLATVVTTQAASQLQGTLASNWFLLFPRTKFASSPSSTVDFNASTAGSGIWTWVYYL